MKAKSFLIGIFTATLCTSAATAQTSEKQPAELLPADTLAYVETHQIGDLAAEVGKLLEGSVLADVPNSLARLNAKYQNLSRFQTDELQGVGLLFAPEVIKELERVRGAAFGLLSLPEKGSQQPEWVAVVFPGKSNVPSFVVRAALVGSGMEMQAVATVDGVPIYQSYYHRYERFPRERGDKPGLVRRKAKGPAIAMTPKMIVLGSTDAVSQVIRRASGSLKDKSLASVAAFKQSKKEIDRDPGFFVYGNVQKLAKDAKGMLDPIATAVFTKVMEVVNPKILRCYASSLSLKNGTLSYRELDLLDPSETSLVLDLLPTEPVNQKMLSFIPSDTAMVVAISNHDGAKRWDLLKKQVDALVPRGPGGGFSDMVQAVEQRLGINVRNDLAGKVTGIVLSVGNPLLTKTVRTIERGPGFRKETVEHNIPIVCVVEVVDEASAKKLIAAIPKIAGMRDFPVKKTVKGVDLEGILMQGKTMFFARQGKTIIGGGPMPEAVADAVTAGMTGKGLMGQKIVAKRLQENHKKSVALFFVKPGTFASGILLSSSSASVSVKRKGRFQAPQIEKKVEPKPSTEQQQLAKSLASERWMIMSIAVDKQSVRINGRMPELDKLVPRVINQSIEQVYERMSRRGISDTGHGDAPDPPNILPPRRNPAPPIIRDEKKRED